MILLYTRTILGIPRRKTPWSDTITGKMTLHSIQTQPHIVCYVNFRHKLEETLFFKLFLIPSFKMAVALVK
jgi:hypothetical protein